MLKYLAVFVFFNLAAEATESAKSIQKATNYLSANLNKLDFSTLATLKTIKRIYGLKMDLAAAEARILHRGPPSNRLWLLEGDSRKQVPEVEIRILHGIPWVVAAATYCDIYDLPWNFIPELRKLSSRGGIAITRSIFALRIIEFNKCRHEESLFVQEKKRLTADLPEVIQRNPVGSQAWSESVLSLYFVGHADWVAEDLLKLLVAEQQDNGSWFNQGAETAKALWVLLEAKYRRLSTF